MRGEQLGWRHTGQVGRVGGFIHKSGWRLEWRMGIGMRTRGGLGDVMPVNRQRRRNCSGATSAGAFALRCGSVVVVRVLSRRRMPLLPLMMMSTPSTTTSSAPKPASHRQQTIGSQSERWTAPFVGLTLTGCVMLRRGRPMQGFVVYVRDVRERAKTRLTPWAPQTVHTVFGPLLLQVLQCRLERSDHSQLPTHNHTTAECWFRLRWRRPVTKWYSKNTKEINTFDHQFHRGGVRE